MGIRLIFCQEENKLINKVNGVKSSDNIYPAILLNGQDPVDKKYLFKDVSDIAKNKCPYCGGNLYFKHEGN